MFENLDILKMAHGLARHAGARQAAVAENIANVNTPGFRMRDVPAFADLHGDGPGALSMRATRAGHAGPSDAFAPPAPQVMRDAAAGPNGNSVSLEDEIVKAAELRQQHDMALSIYQSALTVLRAGIGRR